MMKKGVRKMNEFWKHWTEYSKSLMQTYSKFGTPVNINADKLPEKDQAAMDRMTEDTLHKHKFKRGMLPNQRRIGICDCGVSKDVTFEEWQTLG